MKKPSFCRTCHNGCGVVVEVDDDGRVVSMTGDRENPLYQGYTCVKGRATPHLINSPDRLLHSVKRMPDGRYQRIDVEQAMDEIAEMIQRLVDEHGPRSIAGYVGNALATSFWVSWPAAKGFLEGLGSPMHFDAEAIDQPGKNIAKGCHGMWMAPPNGMSEPEIAMCVGQNPIASHGGFPVGPPSRWLNEQLARGMKLVVIDPRRTDVARRAHLFIQPKPGHDAALLAAMARVIIDEHRCDQEFVAENVEGVEEFRRALEPFTPSLVAERAGVDTDDLVTAARMYGDATRAFIACGTGPSMAASSTLLEYMRMNVMALCGNWQRAGDPLRNAGVTIPEAEAKAQAMPPFPSYGEGFGAASRIRGLSASLAGMPTGALCDEILLPGDGKVRALFACGGNPVGAFPDQLRTIAAMKALDLLVTIDIRMSQTAKVSDYVIATRMTLEVPAVTLVADLFHNLGPGMGLVHSYGQYSPRVVDPPNGSELIEEWELYYGLAKRLGTPLKFASWRPTGEPVVLDMDNKPTSEQILEMHMADARISLDELKRHPHGAFFPDESLVVAPKDEGWEGRLDLANKDMMADLADVGVKLVYSTEDDTYPFRLITRRLKNALNSSYVIQDTKSRPPYNPAFMNPRDLAELGLASGDVVELRSKYAAIPAVVEAEAGVRQGVISMAHGFGGPPDDDDRVLSIGSPTGRLTSAEDMLERYSGEPRMSNIPVRVRAR